MTDYLQRRRYFKKTARSIIYSDWMNQVFVFAVLMVSTAGLNSMHQGLVLLAYSVANNYMFSYALSVFFALFTLAFVIPIVYGVIHFEILAFENKNPKVSNVFDAFENIGMLVRTYKTFISFVARVIPAFIPVFLLSIFIQSPLYYSIFTIEYTIGNVDVVYLLFNILLIVMVFLSLCSVSKYIVGLFVVVKNDTQPVGRCFGIARIICNGYATELFLLVISFVPLLVISLFTLGVAFIVYTLPYILLTFSGMSAFLYNKYMCIYQATSPGVVSDNTDICPTDSEIKE